MSRLVLLLLLLIPTLALAHKPSDSYLSLTVEDGGTLSGQWDIALRDLERAVVPLFAYMSYALAESLLLSGIVSILFCGITMAQYARLNLSDESREFSFAFFKTMALLAE